jgi:hypothetical protein
LIVAAAALCIDDSRVTALRHNNAPVYDNRQAVLQYGYAACAVLSHANNTAVHPILNIHRSSRVYLLLTAIEQFRYMFTCLSTHVAVILVILILLLSMHVAVIL